MKGDVSLAQEFVEYIPNELMDRTLYISMPLAMVVHKCCCGCGNEVVTPLSPTDWKLIYDGVSISLSPSIGNWNFPCQSHYWINDSRVRWAKKWTQEEIDVGRSSDAREKKRYFDRLQAPTIPGADVGAAEPSENTKMGGLWERLKKRLFSLFR